MKKISKKKKKQNKQIRVKLIFIISTLLLFGLILIFQNRLKNKKNSFKENLVYTINGIDLSHHNPIIDWANINQQNIHFAYIKATEGVSHTDRNYLYNYKLAKENNVKIGAYHFFSFGISGKDQALHFIKTANLTSGDLYPVIDIEHSTSNIYSTDTSYQKNIINELITFESYIYDYFGVHPILYTNLDCYNLYVKKTFPENLIWISCIDKDPTELIPNWIIWQFTHKGKLENIDGHIDLNYFRYSFDQLNDISIP